jgi:hypothetical protein
MSNHQLNPLNISDTTRVDQMKTVQAEALELFTNKIQRALSISKNGVVLVEDEKIRDTLLDLHNYAAMGLMLLDE